MFGGLLDETEQPFYACGKDIEISENFPYLGSVMCIEGGLSEQVIFWPGPWRYGLAQH